MSKKIAWLVPSLLEGSGGHRTIFQHIQLLIEEGHKCEVYLEGSENIQIKESKITQFFNFKNIKVVNGSFDEISGHYDLIFATVWYSAKFVKNYPNATYKAYFVQDFEAYFNPMGDGYLMAENSYKLGLNHITIGKWLTNKLRNEFSAKSQYFNFCADLDIYRSLKIKKQKSICFVYQPEKPRRCPVLALEALHIVKQLRDDISIKLFGTNKVMHQIPFEHEFLGLLTIEECNRLYNTCVAGLCISSSNPSRIPFEMMATGLPVVDIYRENNLYDLPEKAVSLASQDPASIAKALIEIIDSKEKQISMSSSGKQYMEDKSLSYGFEQFINSVNQILDGNFRNLESKEEKYSLAPIKELKPELIFKSLAIKEKPRLGSKELLLIGLENLFAKIEPYPFLSIGLFGAGKHTVRLLDETHLKPHKINCILDENPSSKEINGIPIVNIKDYKTMGIDTIVISSDSIENKLLQRLKSLNIKDIKIFTLYSDLD